MTGCFHLRVVKQTKHHVLVKSVVQGVKGTVHVISSNLLFKEGLLRCTTVPLKPLTDLGCLTKLRKHFFIVEVLLANCFKL